MPNHMLHMHPKCAHFTRMNTFTFTPELEKIMEHFKANICNACANIPTRGLAMEDNLLVSGVFIFSGEVGLP